MKKHNSSRKSLPCKVCFEVVNNIGSEAISVICYKCVMNSMRSMENLYQNEALGAKGDKFLKK